MLYRVREAQGQRDSIALDGGFITYTNQLQLTLEALGNTDYHVVSQCTCSTGLSVSTSDAVARGELQYIVFFGHFYTGVDGTNQRTFTTFDVQFLTVQSHLYASRNSDGCLSNARHFRPPIKRRSR